MIQAVLSASKETDHKLRWDSIYAANAFSLYIPKWIVPRPWPTEIKVYIAEVPSTVSDIWGYIEHIRQLLPQTSICTGIKFVAWHTQTAHYRPIGSDPISWEIGEPYLPIELLPEKFDRLIIAVEWLQNGEGSFRRE